MNINFDMALGILVFLPLLAAGLIGLLARLPNLREIVSLFTAITLIWLIAQMIILMADGAQPELRLGQFAGNFELKLKLEPLGAIFAAIASSLWLFNTLFSIGYMRGNKAKHQTRFYACVAIAISAVMGIASAANLITLFIFYEVLTLSTFPLVTHTGDDKAKRGGIIYALFLMATSLGLLLPAIIGTQVIAGTTEFQVGGIFPENTSHVAITVLLFLFAFGIGKAALMPVHGWLPKAMVAPTPVSALLHAVAVVKAGVFTMLKVSIYIFGPATIQATSMSHILYWIAALSIIAASLIAMRQDNLKARLAYSTVSQLCYITFGAMLATPAALFGGALQIVMHAWGKITLFMCAGAIYTIAHRSQVSQLDGLGRAMPWVFGAFLIGALSIIGIPPMGGSWPKFLLLVGTLERGQGLLMGALIISSVLNVIYLMPIAIRGFLKPPADSAQNMVIRTQRVEHIWVIIPPVLTALGAFLLFFFAGTIIDFLTPILPDGDL